MIKNIVYPNLAIVMAANGVNQRELAKIAGVTPSSISQKLSGDIDFKLKECANIAVYFKDKEPKKTMEEIFLQV